MGEFCNSYDYEGCKNDPECVWCVERAAASADTTTTAAAAAAAGSGGAGCLHLSRSSVLDIYCSALIIPTAGGDDLTGARRR